MNSWSILGTHHIFFPPGLQVLPGEYNPDCFPTDGIGNAPAARLLGQEPYGPPRAPIGGRTAHECDHRRFLNAVELALGLRSGVFRQGVLKAGMHVPLTHAGNLPWVPADGRRRRPNALSVVQKQEHSDASPDPRCQLTSTSLNLLQLRAILRREVQTSKPRFSLHPTL